MARVTLGADLVDESTLIPDGADTARSRPSRDGDHLARGSSLGRYVVLERLGAGGMGSVYAAFDPQLDRRVALKVLHAEIERRDPTGTARLLREAQAMARLTHPNVVTVHDVGVEDGQLFVAMELVDGITLKQWRNDSPRTVAESLAVCLAAGRGLVAAHARGLVHRDFKPDNVMVATDGRVLVMDFGLARGRTGAGESADSASRSATGVSDSLASGELTQTGAVLGTPAYMSPEQFAGGVADERSDQFSFCVTVWEQLYGERPYTGDSLATLASAVRSGEITAAPKSVRVPAAIRAALRRGLASLPSDRHASMSALLAALAPKRSRASLGLLGAATVAAVATTAVLSAAGGSNASDICDGVGTAVDEHWNRQRVADIAQAFTATEVPFSEASWVQSSQGLDAFFESWRTARVEVCRASHVRREQSEARLDLRMDCLDDALNHAAATLALFEDADAALVTRAPALVQRLPDPARCTTVLDTGVRPTDLTDEQRAALAEAQRHKAAAHARVDAGRKAAGMEAADAGLAALGDVTAPEVRGDLLAYRALGQEAVGEFDAAKATLREGLAVATKGAAARAEADLWLNLMRIEGAVQKHTDVALAFEVAARLAVERTGDPLMMMKIEDSVGMLLAMDGRGEQASPHFERALAIIAEEGLPIQHAAVVHNNYGLALYDMARYADALQQHRAAHDAQLSRWGPNHPDIATDLSNLGRVHSALGNAEEARDHYERAAALQRRLLGEEHHSVAATLLNLGVLDNAAGDTAAARRRVEEAKRIYEKVHGPDHPYVGFAYLSLGRNAMSEHRFDDAMTLNDKALSILRTHFGPEHPKVLSPMVNRATILSDMDRDAEAVVAYEEVIALQERLNGPEHADLAYALMGLAQTLIDLERAAESVAPAKRALVLREKAGIDPRLQAEARFVLAMTHWASGDDRAYALELARAAANTTRPDGPTASPVHLQIVAWVEERQSRPKNRVQNTVQ